MKMLVYVLGLMVAISVALITCVKLAIMLWHTEMWGVPEYIALLIVDLVFMMTMYGVINSYQEKLIALRKLKLAELEANMKVTHESTAEKVEDRPR